MSSTDDLLFKAFAEHYKASNEQTSDVVVKDAPIEQPKTSDVTCIRFIRTPKTYNDLEVEFIPEGKDRGPVEDIEIKTLRRTLERKGFRWTEVLDRAIDAAWNFYHSVYFPETDEMIIPNE